MWKIVVLGLAIRLAAIAFFSSQDNYYEGVFKFIVDVDYKVYLDASAYDNPYDRHTYRYSPLLAYLVAPSYQTNQLFGKVVIALFDALSMVFIYKIFSQRNQDKQINQKAASQAAYFYCLNPVLIYITVRGSCEGITMALASAFWYFYVGGDANANMSPVERIDKNITERQPDLIKKYLSYALFGLWVHFRVYPIIFVPLLIMHEYHSAKEDKLKKAINFTVEFGIVSGGVFLALAALFYMLYGEDFLNQTYFYHLTRRDNRHSKSAYFYEIYLNYAGDSNFRSASRMINRLIPSIISVLMISFVLVKKRSLFFCYALLTLYFVCFNRVITDQYYMWCFSAIYLVIPEHQFFKQKKWGMAARRLIKDHLIVPLPVILWLMVTLRFERSAPNINIIHVWYCSLFILFIHIITVTRYFGEIKTYSFQNERKRNLETAKQLLSRKKD